MHTRTNKKTTNWPRWTILSRKYVHGSHEAMMRCALIARAAQYTRNQILHHCIICCSLRSFRKVSFQLCALQPHRYAMAFIRLVFQCDCNRITIKVQCASYIDLKLFHYNVALVWEVMPPENVFLRLRQPLFGFIKLRRVEGFSKRFQVKQIYPHMLLTQTARPSVFFLSWIQFAIMPF